MAEKVAGTIAHSISVKRQSYTSQIHPLRVDRAATSAGWLANRPSERIWGFVSGFPAPNRGKRLLVMLQAYIDDSGNGIPPVFVLAGFVSSVERWATFSDEWSAELATAPAIEYFKMKEAADCRGQFAGWRFADRDAKVRRLVSLINQHTTVGLACVVPLGDYESVFKRKISRSMDIPYFLAFYGVMQVMLIAQHRVGDDRPVDFIFDEQGRQVGDALRAWKHWVDFAPDAARPLIGSIPISRNDREVMPLQAADLFAWQVRRRAVDRATEKNHPIMAVLQINSVIIETWDKPKLQKQMAALQQFRSRTGRRFFYEVSPSGRPL